MYDYHNQKNTKLLQERRISFKDIISILDAGMQYLIIINYPNL